MTRPLAAKRGTALVTSALLASALLGLSGCDADIVSTCGQGPSTGGAVVPPVVHMEMGKTEGTFNFHYETRSAHDRVEVLYEGKRLFDSGCVGESRDVSISYGPGESTSVEVVVTPNCAGTPMTSWLFEASCPGPLATEEAQEGGSNVPSVQVGAPEPKAKEKKPVKTWQPGQKAAQPAESEPRR